jgi:hypothetical protein
MTARMRREDWQQGLLVLAYLRKGETFADLAAGFGAGAPRPGGTSTRRSRWCGPRPENSAGYAYVILDDTLIQIDRVARDMPFYSASTSATG